MKLDTNGYPPDATFAELQAAALRYHKACAESITARERCEKQQPTKCICADPAETREAAGNDLLNVAIGYGNSLVPSALEVGRGS